MSALEFSRPVRIEALGPTPKRLEIEANADERKALARRFGLAAIDRLAAVVSLTLQDASLTGAGVVIGRVTQNCVATGAPIEAHVDAPFALVFRPQPESGEHVEEIELVQAELDTIFYEGGAIDIGEAVAETLALNLDPYPRAPDAEEVLKAAGVKSEGEAGPFAVLAGLRDKLKK